MLQAGENEPRKNQEGINPEFLTKHGFIK
jgi:hypothetical protein